MGKRRPAQGSVQYSSSSSSSSSEWLVLLLVVVVMCGFASLERHGMHVEVHPLKSLRTFAVVLNDTFLHPPVKLSEKLIPPPPHSKSEIGGVQSFSDFIRGTSLLSSSKASGTSPRPSAAEIEQRRRFLDGSGVAFKRHLYFSNSSAREYGLVGYMTALAAQPACARKPIFTTMAKVQDDLYWSLIENFFYTMYNFGDLDCAVMICVSDPSCVRRCNESGFPCFDYRHPTPELHVMQQVAEIKLLHVGQALAAGANVMLLDLDVGFLRDPALLFQGFLENPLEQMRAQMDLGFVTDKPSNTAMTTPRPNFGLFLVKAHPYSVKAFARAWRDYQKAPQRKLNLVATDQNAIVNAMKWARWRWDYNFSYFHLGFMLDTYPRPIYKNLQVFLLDKVALGKLDHDPNGIRFELGGVAAQEVLGEAVAVHATCHEGSTKLHALRASNAFWHMGGYYDQQRRTLTKPLMALSRRALREELRSLAFLALATNRTLIVPNVLIGVGSNIVQGASKAQCASSSSSSSFSSSQNAQQQQLQTPYCAELADSRNTLRASHQGHAALHRGEYYWAAWRTLLEDLPELSVVEPGYYHRMRTAEMGFLEPPPPSVHTFDLGQVGEHSPGFALQALLDSISAVDAPRLVIDLTDSRLGPSFRGGPADMHSWAEDSVGAWGDGVVPKATYLPLPVPAEAQFSRPVELFDLCPEFLKFVPGNRSCYGKCK